MRPFRDEDLNSYAAMLGTPELRESLRFPDHKGRPEAWFEMACWLGQWELQGTSTKYGSSCDFPVGTARNFHKIGKCLRSSSGIMEAKAVPAEAQRLKTVTS